MEDFRRKIVWFGALFTLLTLLSACSIIATEVAVLPTTTANAIVTTEPETTSTPTSTSTPTATPTLTPTITATSTPTFTPTITNTPAPTPFGGTGKVIITNRAYGGNEQYLFDFATQQYESIFEGYQLWSISPNNKYAILSNENRGTFLKPDRDLFVASFDGSNPELIYPNAGIITMNTLGWSPDGKSFIFREYDYPPIEYITKMIIIPTRKITDVDPSIRNKWQYYGWQGESSTKLPYTLPEVRFWQGEINNVVELYVWFPDGEKKLVFLAFSHSYTENPGTPSERTVTNGEWQNATFYIVSDKGDLLKEISLKDWMTPWENFNQSQFIGSEYPISPDGQWYINAGKSREGVLSLVLVNLTTGEIRKIPTNIKFVFWSIDWLTDYSSGSGEEQSVEATPTLAVVDSKNNKSISLPIPEFSITCPMYDIQGNVLKLYQNGLLLGSFEVAEKRNFVIMIHAQGTSANGSYSKLEVKINGSTVGEITTTNYWKTYTLETQIEKGPADILIEFNNDFYNAENNQDRNVWIDAVQIEAMD